MNDKFIESEGKELKEYWYILKANKLLFFITFVIVFALIFIFTKLQTPIYQASSKILIQQNYYDAQLITFRNYTPRNTIINNHIEMLKSRTLMQRVVQYLNSEHNKDSLYMKYKKSIKKDLSAGKIKSNMSIIPIKDTDMLIISFRHQNPFVAYYIANVIAEQYYLFNLSMTRGELSEVRAFLEEQLKKVEVELKNSEEILQNYKKNSDVVALSEETNVLVSALSTFQEKYKSQEIELISLQKKYDILENQLNEAQKNLAMGIVNTLSPVTSKLIEDISFLEADMSRYIAQGYTQDHPKIVEIKNKINNLKEQLKKESQKYIEREGKEYPVVFNQEMINEIVNLKIEIESKKALLQALKTVINEYEQEFKKLPQKELELARLERDKRVSEELYLMLKNKHEEYKIAEAGKMGAIKIIDRPVMPYSPVLPKTQRNLVLGFFLALIMGSAIVFLKEYIDDSMKTVEEIEKASKCSIIGTIPAIKIKSDELNGKKKDSRVKLDELQPGSPSTEAYKILRTNIIYLNKSQNNKKSMSFVVSSATKGEGKSTTALNLAISLSQIDKKVLLVDSDLRKPVIESILNIAENKQCKGLANILKDPDTNIKDCIIKTQYNNMFLLSHGEISTNSTELFEMDRMKFIIQELEKHFDYVIYDTPPIINIADSRIIAKYTDGLVWVIQFKKAKRNEIIHTRKMLDNFDINIIGVVINNIDLTGPYGSYYYSYYTEEV